MFATFASCSGAGLNLLKMHKNSNLEIHWNQFSDTKYAIAVIWSFLENVCL